MQPLDLKVVPLIIESLLYTFRLSTKQTEEDHSVEVNEEFKTRQRQSQEKKAEESEKVCLVSIPFCDCFLLNFLILCINQESAF